jgi:energy-converting hydrogenase A subunit M
MTRGTRTTAFALAGAVALASGAYALGSQAGDGSAVAARTNGANAPGYGPPGRDHWREGPGARFDGLADRLGVDPADLRNALDDIAKTHRDDIAQKLADALGIDRAKVDAAFAKLRPKGPDHPAGDDRHHDFAQALADELNLSVDKVQAALDKQRDHRSDPAALAKALGVSTAKLRQAFANVFRDHRHAGPGRPAGPREDALADALGVTPAKLRAAFEKLRANLDSERDAFAAELAKRLNLDVAKVKDALGALLPHGFGRHHP